MRAGWATAVAAIALTAGCGGVVHSSVRLPPPSTASMATTASPRASVTRSPTLADYGRTYTRLVAPLNVTYNAFVRTYNSSDRSSGELSRTVMTAAAKVAVAETTFDTALLRTQWPTSVTPDIRALVAADAADAGDMANYTSDVIQVENRDGAVSEAAAQAVRADLGLPS